jgi:3-methylfumaryl-CoA hydratase
LHVAESGELSTGRELPERIHRPDEVDLFRYSAALWLAHRIHYDRDYARSEGHPGPVVHGPLQGAYLIRLVEDWLAPLGGQITEMSYRHRRTACAGDTLVARGHVASVEQDGDVIRASCEVELIRQEDGAVTTAGRIDTEIPKKRMPAPGFEPGTN